MKEINLPPKYEKILQPLLTGLSITRVAKELEINRITIYEILKKPEVEARYNQLLYDLKENVKHGLNNLYLKSIQALSECLESDNPALKFKTAIYLLAKLDQLSVGYCDPEKIIEDREERKRRKKKE